MTQSLFSQNKGIYSLITTFLFILIIAFAVLGMIWIASKLKVNKSSLNDDLNKYNYMMDAKNRILSKDCHGQTISAETANVTCSFPPNVIKGYIIEMQNFQNCGNETWEHKFSTEDPEIFSYLVPIEYKGLICPGKLKVLI